MTDNLLNFPAIRLAFKETTDMLDELMQEAVKSNEHAVANAYRNAFKLVRKGIKQAENQGQCKIQKQIDETKSSVNGVAKNVKENKESISKTDTKAEVNSKEIELLKLQIKEIQIKSNNPLGG